MQGVSGSIPLTSTKIALKILKFKLVYVEYWPLKTMLVSAKAKSLCPVRLEA
jgi:hypothetical protein